MRVRVATQPTFTRYVFEMSDVIPVTTDRAKDALVITFGMPLKFDLLDAKANLPPVIKSIDGFVDADGTTDTFCAPRCGRHPHLPRGHELRRRYRRVGCEGEQCRAEG